MRRHLALLALPVLLLGAGCGGDDDDVSAGGGDGSFCDTAVDLQDRFDQLDSLESGEDMPTSEEWEEAADAIRTLGRRAPGEIKADIEVVADGVRRLGVAFEGVDFNDPETLSDPEVMARFESLEKDLEGFEESGERVEEYLRDECGIDFEDTDDTDGEIETDTTQTTEE